MVVDHIDTNRCNNRPENLRWVTRLENALNNPYTRKRIINICGSIENFLNNPSLLREESKNPNFKWMRTVSKAEAQNCFKRLNEWLKEDEKLVNGNGLGEWIFSDYLSPAKIMSSQYQHLDTCELEADLDNRILALSFLLRFLRQSLQYKNQVSQTMSSLQQRQ